MKKIQMFKTALSFYPKNIINARFTAGKKKRENSHVKSYFLILDKNSLF